MKMIAAVLALSCLFGITLAQGPARAPAASAPGGAAGGGSGTGGSGIPTSLSEADVLTFAYNLECLEGHFYSCAAFGTPLATSITGNGPAPSSCKKASLSSAVGTYAAELAREETAHVNFLFSALTQAGGSPRCPQVNIDSAFEAAAEAAFMAPGTPLNPIFDPYANDLFFLHGAFIFEDLGVSAYLGGGGLLTTPAYRLAAAQIGNTESYHAGQIRLQLYQNITTVPAYGSSVSQITTAITNTLNQLSGSPQLKYTLTNAQGSAVSNVDSMAFVPAATPAQVTRAVTLGAPAGRGGGFFPNNLNGNIKN